jgi:hypothetical protein
MSVFRHTNRSRCKPTRTHFQVWITRRLDVAGLSAGPRRFVTTLCQLNVAVRLVIRNTGFTKASPH